MRALAALAVLAIAASFEAASGCGGNKEQPPPAGGAIAYTRTGGIAGEHESLTIAEDGAAKLDTGYGPSAHSERFQVPAQELEAITSELAAADFTELDTGIEEGCADCFLFELRFGEESASADSVTVNDAFMDAIAPLEKLIAERD